MARPTDGVTDWATTAAASRLAQPGSPQTTNGSAPGDPLPAEELNYLRKAYHDWFTHLMTPQTYRRAFTMPNPASGSGQFGWKLVDIALGTVVGPPALAGFQPNVTGAGPIAQRELDIWLPTPKANFGAITLTKVGCLLQHGGGDQLTISVGKQKIDGTDVGSVPATTTITATHASPTAVELTLAEVLDPDYRYTINFEPQVAATPSNVRFFLPYVEITRSPGE